ncbi:MAG: type II secretion system F family protein [Candidatus Omnitrophica bacterium]|nr:type II secretion system F family protein [Candidatus Omnitrophota bacterium]
MKKYKYRAKKGPEQTVEGIIAAESQDDAIDKINEMGLFPVAVDEDGIRNPSGRLPSFSKNKLKPREIITFYRQLGKLIKSGVPILQAITAFTDQSTAPKLKTILERIRHVVSQGQTLSTALTEHPAAFSVFDVALIQAGEAAGHLDESLLRIADYRMQQDALVSKIKMALAYPLFILTMGILAVIFMLTYVVPKFSSLFADFGQKLPAITRILIAISHLLQHYGGWLLIVLILGYALGKKLLSLPSERKKIHRSYLKIPYWGELYLKVEISRFVRTLALLLKNGIPILNALQIALPVIRNEAVRQDAQACYEAVQNGRYLSDGLKKSRLFPPLLIQLVALGEESGRLDETLLDVSDWYEQDTVESLAVATRLLEPLVILAVGLVLGFFIIAILLPVFSIDMLVDS